MRLRIEYGDHNERFGSLLPREGVVESTPRCADSSLVWYVIRLDKPLRYEDVEYRRFLIASRWLGHQVGDPDPTAVFILLVPPSQDGVEDGFSRAEFRHVAWGMAHPAKEG